MAQTLTPLTHIVFFGTEASMSAEPDGTACAVRAIWGIGDPGVPGASRFGTPGYCYWSASRTPWFAAHCSMRKCRESRDR